MTTALHLSAGFIIMMAFCLSSCRAMVSSLLRLGITLYGQNLRSKYCVSAAISAWTSGGSVSEDDVQVDLGVNGEGSESLLSLVLWKWDANLILL